jgi:nitroreductase
MNVFEAIEQRRAVKHYDPAHRMTEQEISRLMEAARLSPTSFNIQNWRFVLVQNPELRQHIRAAAWDQAQVTDASLLIILCGDTKSWNKEPQRYWRQAPQEVQDFLVPALVNFYESRGEQTQRDEAMRSVGMAAQTIMLSAKEMGYDSCPMIGFDPQAVAEIINLPSDHVIGMMIAVGKATQPARSRGGAVDESDVVIRDRFAA